MVGVDGSEAALDAVRWAVDEAVDRDAPLRLVHATNVGGTSQDRHDDFRLEEQYAETVLRAAAAAVEATGKPVKVESRVYWGDPESGLLEESHGAALLCVGSTGIGFIANRILGSTAATVAEKAACPVAILRRTDAAPCRGGAFLAVAVDDASVPNHVVTAAMEEARLRDIPALIVGFRRDDEPGVSYHQMDRYVAELQQRYPGVAVYPVVAEKGIAGFAADNREDGMLMMVIGAEDAGRVADIVGPHDRATTARAQCSVLVAR